jgi:hypothetical protein
MGFVLNSVVIDDLDFVDAVFPPHEAEPPSIIDPNAVLTPAIAFERLQAISWRDPEVAELGRIVEHIEQSKPGSKPVGRSTRLIRAQRTI